MELKSNVEELIDLRNSLERRFNDLQKGLAELRTDTDKTLEKFSRRVIACDQEAVLNSCSEISVISDKLKRMACAAGD